jgi:hypothetical protein
MRRQTAVWLRRLRSIAIALTSTTLFFGAIALEAESLLACVTAGLIAANRRRECLPGTVSR